jgi:hypothetical protein
MWTVVMIEQNTKRATHALCLLQHRFRYRDSNNASAMAHRQNAKGWSSGHLKDGKLFEEACRWLNDEIVPIRPSTKTWAQAAQSLLTWLDFLEEVEVDWRYASRADLVAYRDAYLSAISPQTGKEYSPNTIAVRMTYIIDFIRFAVEHEWIDSDLRTGPVVAPDRFAGRPSTKMPWLTSARVARARLGTLLRPLLASTN